MPNQQRGLISNPEELMGVSNPGEGFWIPLSQKGADNGVATLNGSGDVPEGELGLALTKAGNLAGLASDGEARQNLHIPELLPVQAVATSNITLSGTQTVDGYALTEGSLCLCTAQTESTNNGPWEVKTGAWVRPTDFATGNVVKARKVAVINGNVNAKSEWLLVTNSSVTVGTTAQTWELLQASSSVFVTKAEKGAASGVAQLDSESHLLTAELPPSVVNGSSTKLFPVAGNNLTAAIEAIEAAGAGILYVPGGQTVTTTATTVLPNAVTGLRIDGTVVCTANVTIFKREGSGVGGSIDITAPIVAGARTVSCTPTGSVVGDLVFVVSADTLPGATDKLGYLRYIKSLTEGTVTFDAPIPREMASSTRRYRKIIPAAPITIDGSGTVGYNNQEGTSAVFIFLFCEKVTIASTLTVSTGGDTAIAIQHTVGFDVNARIDNFRDEVENGHNGYGVNCGGASRDGHVGGHISHCRHGFTTNVGPENAEFNFYGEPENVYVDAVVSDCTNSSYDSHRAGWGISYWLNQKGTGGGIKVRCDAVTVLGGNVDGSWITPGVLVEPNIVVPPKIGPINLLNISGTAVELLGPAYFDNLTVINCSGTAVETAAGVAAYISQGLIDGKNNAGAKGLILAGEGSRIRGMQIKNCPLGYEETATGTNNTVDAEFSGCTENERRVNYTATRSPAYSGDSITAHVREVGYWIAPAALSVSTGSLASGLLELAPIDIADGTTLSEAALEVTTEGSAGTLRIGLYFSEVGGLPGALAVEFGTVSFTHGVLTVAKSSGVLRGGRYWAAVLSEATGVSLRTQACLGADGSSAANALASGKGSYSASGVATGKMPATPPTLTGVGTVARVAFKIASVQP